MKKILIALLIALCAFAFVSCDGGEKECEHVLTHHDAVAADCTKTGTIEYWSCELCGLNFADAEGKTEVTELSTPQGHNIDPATHICSGCSKYLVTTWAEFKAAVDADVKAIYLANDIAWGADAALDIEGLTIDLNGCKLTGIGAANVTGASFTIANGTLDAGESAGTFAVGDASATAVAIEADCTAVVTDAVTFDSVTFNNANLLLGIGVYANLDGVAVTSFADNGIYFNGASGTIKDCTVAGGSAVNNTALHIVGGGSVAISGTNSFTGAKIGLKAYRGATVDIDGTTTLTAAQEGSGNELAIQVYESAYITVKTGAVLNLVTDANQNQGAIALANAYKGTRSAGICVKSGATLNFVRATKGETNALFWASNKAGRYLVVFENGSTVTDKIGTADPVKAVIATVDASSAAVCDGFVRCPAGAVSTVYTTGTPEGPADGSNAYSFYDFR